MTDITDKLIICIRDYYDIRGLKWPTFDDAMKFAHTEIAEVYELDLARTGGYVRNHPENKPIYSPEKLSEELGDAILMLIVAGIVEGVNPLQSLLTKIGGKVRQDYIKFLGMKES